MADNDNDTSTAQKGTQDSAASASTDAQVVPASPAGNDEVSVLRSRYAGQTAKVNELTSQVGTLASERDELKKQLTKAQGGTASADEAAKALLAAKDEELAQVRREASLARIEGKYPEVYRELGDDAAGLSEAKLAAMEARLRGSAGEDESDERPTPRGQNAARKDGVPAAGREPKEQTSADIVATLGSMALPPEWGGPGA